ACARAVPPRPTTHTTALRSPDHGGPRFPPPSPTRRSSDLLQSGEPAAALAQLQARHGEAPGPQHLAEHLVLLHHPLPRPLRPQRSEEHTSELQSRENLVCRLLLEKKKASVRAASAHAVGTT